MFVDMRLVVYGTSIGKLRAFRGPLVWLISFAGGLHPSNSWPGWILKRASLFQGAKNGVEAFGGPFLCSGVGWHHHGAQVMVVLRHSPFLFGMRDEDEDLGRLPSK